MTTLALDTSTAAASFALVSPAGVWEHRPGPAPGGRRVLEGVHGLLAEAGARLGDATRIVVGVGPGNFTGLRIGAATALALGQALGVPVVGASSLEALALDMAGRVGSGVMAAATDARRGEVFAGAFRVRGDRVEALVAIAARDPAEFARLAEGAGEGGPVWVAGTGLDAHGDALLAGALAAVPGAAIRAADLVRRVDAGGARPARPDYRRLPDAEVARLRRAEGVAG